jgi:hypothetical protein
LNFLNSFFSWWKCESVLHYPVAEKVLKIQSPQQFLSLIGGATNTNLCMTLIFIQPMEFIIVNYFHCMFSLYVTGWNKNWLILVCALICRKWKGIWKRKTEISRTKKCSLDWRGNGHPRRGWGYCCEFKHIQVWYTIYFRNCLLQNIFPYKLTINVVKVAFTSLKNNLNLCYSYLVLFLYLFCLIQRDGRCQICFSHLPPPQAGINA